jgi:hypothetical protein
MSSSSPAGARGNDSRRMRESPRRPPVSGNLVALGGPVGAASFVAGVAAGTGLSDAPYPRPGASAEAIKRSRCPAGRSQLRLSAERRCGLSWCVFQPGTAAGLWLEKGSVLLKEAVPSSPIHRRRTARRGGVGRIPIGVDRTSCRRQSKSSTAGRRCSAAAGSAPTGTATGRCSRLPAAGRIECGRSKAATASGPKGATMGADAHGCLIPMMLAVPDAATAPTVSAQGEEIGDG